MRPAAPTILSGGGAGLDEAAFARAGFLPALFWFAPERTNPCNTTMTNSTAALRPKTTLDKLARIIGSESSFIAFGRRAYEFHMQVIHHAWNFHELFPESIPSCFDLILEEEIQVPLLSAGSTS